MLIDKGTRCVRIWLVPSIAALSIVFGGVGWVMSTLLHLQDSISSINAIQQTVLKEQTRHEGMITACQTRTARIEVIENELIHLKEGFEEHRKLTEVKK